MCYANAKAEFISNLKVSNAANKKLALVGASLGHQKTVDFVKETYPDATTEIIDLNLYHIVGFEYRKTAPEDFNILIKKIQNCDTIVLATPVYCNGCVPNNRSWGHEIIPDKDVPV